MDNTQVVSEIFAFFMAAQMSETQPLWNGHTSRRARKGMVDTA